MGCLCRNDVEEVVKIPNDEFFDGPVKNRSCQDIPWLILFIIFICGMLSCVAVAVCKGDIDRIINGLDSYGNVCGKVNKKIDNFLESGQDYTEFKFLEKEGGNMNRLKPKFKCVKACDSVNRTAFLNRCINKEVVSKFKHAGTTNVLSTASERTSFFREAAGDIQFCWEEILYLCLLALILTVVIVFMFRYMAKVIIYVSMVAMIILSTAAIIYIWYQYAQSKLSVTDGRVTNSRGRVQRSNERNWLTGAVISTIIYLFFMLMMWSMRKRIKLVVALFYEASKALIAMPFLIIQPVWTFICLALILLSWLYAIMWIQSSGDFEVDVVEKRVHLRHGDDIKVMKWYFVFGLLWMSWFCFGCQHSVTAGAVAKWFFTRDKSNLGSPILGSLFNTIRYHLGSIAVGSFIISVIKFIRMTLRFLERNMSNSRNPNVACLFMFIQCCIQCLESCLKYITRNAYIEIAIYGFSFCKGAKKAFQVIVANSLRVAAINSVGDFALFMAKALVVVIVTFVGMELIRHKVAVVHVWVPVTLAAFFAYLIVDCFLSVYEMTIDTIFLCFCEDCELNDGITRPYFMSMSLMGEMHIQSTGQLRHSQNYCDNFECASSVLLVEFIYPKFNNYTFMEETTETLNQLSGRAAAPPPPPPQLAA